MAILFYSKGYEDYIHDARTNEAVVNMIDSNMPSGQTVIGNGLTVTSVSFLMHNYGTGAPNVQAVIYETTGDPAAPTGSAVATSTNTVSSASLPDGQTEDPVWVEFTFTGYTLTLDQVYAIGLDTVSSNPDPLNCTNIIRDTSNSYSGGHIWYNFNTALTALDYWFKFTG